MSDVQSTNPIDAMRKRRRKIHSQRARKLRRRGEFVWWDTELKSLVWVKHG